jgi:transposase-like protein
MPSYAKLQGQPYLRDGLTKRQTEVLERVEQGYPVNKIARDMGVTRNAVYQTIERLRRAGALPEAFTPSGQPPRRSGAELRGGATGSPALAPRESRLAELRALGGGDREGASYAELIEAAIAGGDAPALAYELGRADADAGGEAGLSRDLVEAALRRLGVLPAADN